MAAKGLEVYDPGEEQIRRVRLALFKRFTTQGYSKNKGITVDGKSFGPGEPLDPEHAKKLAFQIGGRRPSYPFLLPGSNEPTAESRARAKEKLLTPDAAEKRQQYEEMLAIGRKSGHYRLVAERNERTKRLEYVLQPGGMVFKDRDLAEIALEYFNSQSRKS